MRDTTLTDLFIRDLDQIALPPRAQWIRRPAEVVPAGRRRPSFAFATAIVALIVVAIIAGLQTPVGREVLDRLQEGLTQPDTYEYQNARSAVGYLNSLEVTEPSIPTILEAATRSLELRLQARGDSITITRPSYGGGLERDFDAFRQILRDLSRRLSIDPSELEDLAIAGMATVGGTPCNSYYRSSRLELAVERALNTDSGRIGASWTSLSEHSEELPVIQVAWPDGPADRAGVRAGDRILRVDGRDVRGMMSSAEITLFVAGPPGTVVQLDLVRGEREISLAITREVASSPPGLEARLLPSEVAYLDLRIGVDSEEELRAAIDGLEPDAEGWVVDLRTSEFGGEIRDYLVGAFSGPGAYATGRTRVGGPIVVSGDPSARRIDPRPVAVLVDERTAHDALATAQALRERGVARLIGEPTLACDSSYIEVQLGSGTLHIRGSNFVSIPGGIPLHRGITPDDVVLGGDAGDPQLEAAHAWVQDQIR